MGRNVSKIYVVVAVAIVIAIAVFGYMTREADAAGWTGCYVGAGGGYSAALTDTSLDAVGYGTLINVDSFAAQGGSVFGTVGCDIKVAPKIVVGAFGDFSHFVDTDFSVSSPALAAYTKGSATILETSVDQSWSIGGRLGFLVTDDVMVYGLAGYTQAQIDDISSPALGISIGVPDLTGYVIGAGTEVALGRNLFLQAQYTYSNYADETIDLTSVGAPGLGLNLDTDIQTARVGLLFKFGGSEVDRIIPSTPLK